MLEKAFEHPRTKAGTWTWLVDFNGFGFRHAMNVRMGIQFAHTFENHFPERLGKVVLVNPPSIFDLALSGIKHFADQRTVDKIFSVSGKLNDEEFYKKLFEKTEIEDEGLRTWIRTILTSQSQLGGLPVIGARNAGEQWQDIRDVQLVSKASWVASD